MQVYERTDELTHHGTKGMKWGVRRYQNKDGSLTNAGKKRYGTKANFDKVQKAKADAKASKKKAKLQARVDAEIAKYKGKSKTSSEKPKQKSVSEMTDDEIRKKIERLKLEKELASLRPETKSMGKRFVEGTKDVIASSIYTSTKDVGAKWMKKNLSKLLGVDEESLETAASKAKKASAKLKQEAEDAENRRRKAQVDDYFEAREKEKQEQAAAEKETKREEKKTKKESTSKDDETYEYTVVGEGTSKRSKTTTRDFVDTEWSKAGEDYVNNYLELNAPTTRLALDDPNKKKK